MNLAHKLLHGQIPLLQLPFVWTNLRGDVVKLHVTKESKHPVLGSKAVETSADKAVTQTVQHQQS
jgi:hypothetical protein